MNTNPSLPPVSRIGTISNRRKTDHARTGEIDAILFGRVIELLDAATLRLAGATHESRVTFARLDGEVEGIARTAALLSGRPSDELRRSSADRIHRIGR